MRPLNSGSWLGSKMKLLTIGIDIDGVIVDYASAILPLLSKICQRPVSYEDLSHWNIGEALNIGEEAVDSVWEQVLYSDLLRYASPIDGALEGLSTLRKHEIWLVTARPKAMQNLTLSWLGENKVKYDGLVFESGTDKLSVGPDFDVFIEDNVKQARAMAEAGIFSLLLDQPWNQTAILPQNCKRVPDWNTILDSISELE